MASPIRAPMDIEPLGNIGGLLTPREDFVPNIQSVYGDIIQNAPDYQYFTAPLSNQGRTTATYGGKNNIVVAPDTPIRVVDNATGQVVYSGVGYEGAQGAIDAANALSASTGKKANWDIQVAGPTMQGFQSVSTDRPDVSGLGILADVALPVAGSLLAGPLGLGALGLGTAGTAAAGAALGSGLSSAAQGRSIEDALLRAAIAGGTSYLGGQLFGPASPTGDVVAQTPSLAGDALANLPSLLDEIAATAAQNLASAGLGSVVPAAVSGLSGDIIATAIREASPSLIPSVVSGAVGAVPSFFDAAQLNNVTTVDQTPPAEQPSDYVVTAQVPAATTPAPTIPGILPPTTTTKVPAPNPAEDIVATAQTQTQPVTPTPVVLPPATTPAASTTTTPAPNPAEDLTLTAQTQPTSLLPAALLTPAAVAAAAAANAAGATTTAAEQAATRTSLTPEELAAINAGAGAGGVLGTGLTATQLAALAGLGVSGLSSLLGGGGTGTTPTTPYVSPFGAMGGGFGAGVDYRVNPNIIDYERYGFGPEASFFRPEYSGLVSRAAGFTPSTTQTTSGGGTANPVYQPLIGPNNPAAYQQGGPNPDAMRLMNFNPMSGLTGNGILDRLQQQFNQAGSTYVSKTDGTVPTQLTQEELWGIMS